MFSCNAVREKSYVLKPSLAVFCDSLPVPACSHCINEANFLIGVGNHELTIAMPKITLLGFKNGVKWEELVCDVRVCCRTLSYRSRGVESNAVPDLYKDW